jgi:sterol desaturase/sphingolipid hydroxylase (fatty acid hydroxylase superfamily)
MIQIILIILTGAFFLLIERLVPGRDLPNAPGWYLRSIVINILQFSLVFVAGATWNAWFQGWSLFEFSNVAHPIIEGLAFWFVGTFVFYWWHRLRHHRGWWVAFHQVHHSPTRIEALTAFYKHPIEMVTNSILISAIIFLLFGGSLEAAAWYNVFAVLGEFLYHANIRTPKWFGYFIQRPEHHSIHHQLGVHSYNFGDITWWDRLFGTFKEAETFVKKNGFKKPHDTRLWDMLLFKDVNKS